MLLSDGLSEYYSGKPTHRSEVDAPNVHRQRSTDFWCLDKRERQFLYVSILAHVYIRHDVDPRSRNILLRPGVVVAFVVSS